MARNRTETAKNEQKQFFKSFVGVFLKNGEIGQMTVDNGFGAISISRMPSQSVTHAIGFGADWDDEQDDYENYDDEDDEGVQDEW